MKYKVKYWDSQKKAFVNLYYPYLETALMMGNKICHQIHDKVFVIEKDKSDTYIVEV